MLALTATGSSTSVRTCDYVPGQSQPAQIPAGNAQPTGNPSPTPLVFSQAPQDATTIANQMRLYDQIVKDITDHYYSTDYNGADWSAIQAKYKLLIQNGLSQADFYRPCKKW